MEHTAYHWWCPKCGREADWRDGANEVSVGMVAGQGLHIPCSTRLELRKGSSMLSKPVTDETGRGTPETDALVARWETIVGNQPDTLTFADLKLLGCALTKELADHARDLERKLSRAQEERDLARREQSNNYRSFTDALYRATQAERSLAELEPRGKDGDMLERRIRQMIGARWDRSEEYLNACQRAIQTLEESRARVKGTAP